MVNDMIKMKMKIVVVMNNHTDKTICSCYNQGIDKEARFTHTRLSVKLPFKLHQECIYMRVNSILKEP